MNKLGLALGLTAGLILPGCQATKESTETTTPNRSAVMRKATDAKIKYVLNLVYYCASSRRDRDRTAKQRCSDKAKVNKYWDKRNRTHCFDCKEEREVIE